MSDLHEINWFDDYKKAQKNNPTKDQTTDQFNKKVRKDIAVGGILLVGVPLVTAYGMLQLYDVLKKKKAAAPTAKEKETFEWKIKKLLRRAKKLVTRAKKNG